MSIKPKQGGSSPWGPIQYLSEPVPGIVSVGTASHGGFWISPEREAQIPAAWKAAARQYAPAQWYEEDCDVCAVGATFPEEFRAAGLGGFADGALAYVAKDTRFTGHQAGSGQ